MFCSVSCAREHRSQEISPKPDRDGVETILRGVNSRLQNVNSASTRSSTPSVQPSAAREKLKRRDVDALWSRRPFIPRLAEAITHASKPDSTRLGTAAWKLVQLQRKKRQAARSTAVREYKEQLQTVGLLACTVCGWSVPAAVRDSDTSKAVHLHHVVPIASGGGDEASNLVLLCPNHHTVAHRIGTLRNGLWFGPRDREELLSELRLLEQDPETWLKLDQARFRKVVLRDDE